MAEAVKDALNARAVVWLRSHVCAIRRQAAADRVTGDDRLEQAGRDGCLLAVEHAGAVSADEAAAWRRRFADAAVEGAQLFGPIPPEVRNRAVAHLETLVAGLAPGAREASAAMFSAVRAYASTGVLTADEALAWRERMRAVLGLEPEQPPVCHQRDLVRVVTGPDVRHDGVRITNVTLYADGVVLYWHQADRWPDGPDTPRLWSGVDREASWDVSHPHELTDDVGTRYLGHGTPYLGLCGGGWVVRFGTSVFTPAVPQAARSLRVPLRGGDIDVDLVAT